MHNILGLKVLIIEGDDSIELSHINFENAAFIWVTSNSDLKKFIGEDGLIVPDELKKSSYGSGNYLIFTDVSGIADDGGWYYVKVEHADGLVTWEFTFNNAPIKLTFDLDEYCNEINKIVDQLKLLPSDIALEPQQVIFPEE